MRTARGEERRAYLQYLARILSGFRAAAVREGEGEGEGDPRTVRRAGLLADAANAASAVGRRSAVERAQERRQG